MINQINNCRVQWFSSLPFDCYSIKFKEKERKNYIYLLREGIVRVHALRKLAMQIEIIN